MKINENAERVLKARYYKRDENNEVIEDFRGLCKRVSSHIASVEKEPEKWEKDFYNLIYNLDFLPNSPTLMNAGSKNGLLSACIGEGTLVYTKHGMIPIEKITIGDEVLTHKMRFKKATNTSYNGIKDVILATRGPDRRKRYSLSCTPDHKIRSSNKWKNSISAKFADVPRLWKTNIPFPKSFDLTNDCNMMQKGKSIKEVIVLNNRILLKNNNKKKKNNKYDNQETSPFCIIKNTSKLAFLFGVYLANGNIDGTNIRFCLNSNDIKLIDDISHIIFNIFGIAPKIIQSNHGNWVTLNVHSRWIKNLLVNTFGDNTFNKKLPEWISNADKKYRKALLDGILVDGYRNSKNSYTLVLANPTLTYQSLLLGRSIGWYASFTSDMSNKLSKHTTSGAHFSRKKYTEYYIKTNIVRKEKVYDITVEDDHSYIAGDIIVHNCFTIDVEDNMGSILEAVSDTAKIFKNGGGVGLSFNSLRPEGSLIKTTGGTSSGPISFMRLFDTAAEVVKQGGKRRAALMGVLNCDHKDVEKFVDCKSVEGILPNFNISIAITNDFMAKVKRKDKETMPLWNKIVSGAHQNGEPGVIFIDTVNDTNPVPHMGYIKSSNPCQPEHALLLDGDRLRRIDEQGDNWESVKAGEKEVFELKCNNGLKLHFTSNHEIMLEDGNWIKTDNSLNRSIKWGLGDRNGSLERNRLLQGFIFGDGFLCGNKYGISIKLNPDKEKEIYEFLISMGFHNQDSGALYANLNDIMDEHGITFDFLNQRVFDRDLPDYILYSSSSTSLSFLRGLFEANGSVSNIGQISLKGTCLSMIEKVQLILASFGIPSWITTNKPFMIKWENGSYESRESYNLQIAPRNAYKFLTKIGFYSDVKNNKIKEFSNEYNTKLIVVSIKSLGIMPVYDYTMKIAPQYNWCQGIIAKNCGEFFFVPYGSCNLGSINLNNMLKAGGIDWEKLEVVTRLSVRFLDDVITANWYPLEKIKDITLKTRPIGLGIMGFADMLLKMEIRYDSSDGLSIATDVMKFIKDTAWDESSKLGKEKGNFPEFEKSVLSDKHSTLRNCQTTVIAPTGSLSLIAGVSSGIEPNFAWKTTMHRIGTTMEDLHPLATKFFNKDEKLPDYFVTGRNISTEWHIRMQAAFQSHIDNAISKTINMPNSASIDDVHKAYMLAWELKTKGVTVYREGSRVIEVLTRGNSSFKNKENKKDIKLTYRERPEFLRGITTKQKTGCGNSYITVNFTDDGYPMEVFGEVSARGGCDAMSEGLARMTSLALRYGIKPEEIVKQLRSVRCSTAISKKVGCLSCPDLMGKILIESYTKKQSEINESILCPDCNTQLETLEGCIKCMSCGYSKCG